MEPHIRYAEWTYEELRELERWDWERTHIYSYKGLGAKMGVNPKTLRAAVCRAREMFRFKRKAPAEDEHAP
jgi:hypothetical protein